MDAATTSSSTEAAAAPAPSKPKKPRAPRVKQRPKVRQPLPDDSPWTADEVAWFLGCSASLVYQLEAAGRLPANPRLSARVLFDPQTVKIFKRDPDHFKKGPRARRKA